MFYLGLRNILLLQVSATPAAVLLILIESRLINSHSTSIPFAIKKKRYLVAYSQCQPEFWQCSNHKCIPNSWKCDGNDDCDDGSDEKVSINVVIFRK